MRILSQFNNKAKGEIQMKKVITIQNETGIHARPAAVLVQTATKFSSDVMIEFKDKSINAKSIMNILSASLRKGDEITLNITGSDEEEAMKTIAELLNSNFGE